MRQPLLVFAILAAGLGPPAARAQAAQDRYGPPAPDSASLRGAETAAQAPAPLSWPGKVQALRGPEADAGALRGPAPLDTATGRAMRQANPEQASPRRLALAPAPSRPAPAAPPSQPLPTSLYDRTYAGTAPAARPTAPVQQGRLLAAAAPIPPPSQAPAQSLPAIQGQGPVPAGETTPRFYSLHREYGLTPDPAPPVQPSVLELGPTVAQAMADDKDSPSIDLAGQDQASADAPPRNRNTGNGSTSSSANGQATSTYTIKQ